MGRGVFITGTDTGVGKTLITGLLARFLSEDGMNVITQKWVQTGCVGLSEDIEQHRRLAPLLGRTDPVFDRDLVPYIFKMPSSPHLASRMARERIDISRIISSYTSLVENFDMVLVEGAGGLMVPIDEGTLLVDIAEELRLPVIVVVGNRLGAINHSLLTFEALRKRGIPVLGVIYNDICRTDPVILKDNMTIIERISGTRTICSFRYSGEKENLYRDLLSARGVLYEMFKQ